MISPETFTTYRRVIGSIVTIASLLMISACWSSDDSGVREYVDEAISGLEQGYYADGPGWERAVKDALPELYRAERPSDTYAVLSELTKIAGGDHSFFSTPAEMEALRDRYPSGEIPMPEVAYDGRIGVITIPPFSSAHKDEIRQYLDAAGRALRTDRARSACGWIVDVGTNTGGDMRCSWQPAPFCRTAS